MPPRCWSETATHWHCHGAGRSSHRFYLFRLVRFNICTVNKQSCISGASVLYRTFEQIPACMLGHVLSLCHIYTLCPRALRVSFNPCNLQWPTITSFVNSSQSNILSMDMPCGNQAHGNQIGLWKSAMLVSYVMANSIAFSMLCVPQKHNPTRQRVMNNLFPDFQITSARVLSALTITVRPESS